jgi:signal transduction histidine kinase
MIAPKKRSVSLPITLSVISVGLSAALLVGWIYVIIRNNALTQEVTQNTLLMVSGVVSFIVIMTVLVLFTVFLVREIFEVRRQSTFMSSVTHELKSPLASLRLCAETMGRAALDAERREQLRGMMLMDIERLGALINRILEASRVGGGLVAGVTGQVDLHQLIERSALGVTRRYKLPEGAIRLEMDDALEIVSDPEALETVMDNLLDNAVKYSDASPQVTIRAQRAGTRQVVVEVEDRGIGMTRQDLKRVFERFYRAPEEAVRARHGTGLGLFLVAAHVASLGGKIDARSPGLGRGSTMRMTLPIRRGRA